MIPVKLKKSIWSFLSLLVKRLSRNYIAGPSLSDAHTLGKYLHKRNYLVSYGYWDSPDDNAEEVFNLYVSSMDMLTKFSGNNYLSIKIPALNYEKSLFVKLLNKSQTTGVQLHFDSLSPEHASRIFAFIQDLSSAEQDHVGCTLPGRWQRSMQDAELAIKLGLNIRVVKGQWEDPDNPGYDAAMGYLNIIKTLSGRAKNVRIATHNYDLASESIQLLKASNTPCELELLYGLPSSKIIELAEQNHIPVRIYIAFGHAYLPYALASFRKNPATILKLTRELLRFNYLASFKPLRVVPQQNDGQPGET